MAPHSSTLAWKSHGRRSLVGCSPWGREESDMTERLHFHFSLSCIGEGNGNPLRCSCLENPRDGGAWWAAIYGVAQSRTWLKRLSSSSRNSLIEKVTYHKQQTVTIFILFCIDLQSVQVVILEHWCLAFLSRTLFFLAAACYRWRLSSPTGDQTCAAPLH